MLSHQVCTSPPTHSCADHTLDKQDKHKGLVACSRGLGYAQGMPKQAYVIVQRRRCPEAGWGCSCACLMDAGESTQHVGWNIRMMSEDESGHYGCAPHCDGRQRLAATG